MRGLSELQISTSHTGSIGYCLTLLLSRMPAGISPAELKPARASHLHQLFK